VDESSGQKKMVRRKSFIADIGLPGRRVVRIQNPHSGQVLFGDPYPRMPGK
jgi:hypothetical protein